MATTIWLAVFSAVLLVVRARRPRPSWARVFRQPGTLATLAGAALTAAEAVTLAPAYLVGGSEAVTTMEYNASLSGMFSGTGAAVGLLWLSAILARQWRPERSAIDRAGRVLGICWIAVFLAHVEMKMDTALALSQGMQEMASMQQAQAQQEQVQAASDLKYAEDMRRYFLDKQAWLDKLIQGGGPEQINIYLKDEVQRLDEESQRFEVQEQVRLSRPAGLSLPLPPPPDVPTRPSF